MQEQTPLAYGEKVTVTISDFLGVLGTIAWAEPHSWDKSLEFADWCKTHCELYAGMALSVRVACIDPRIIPRYLEIIVRYWRPLSVQFNVPGGSSGVVPAQDRGKAQEQ